MTRFRSLTSRRMRAIIVKDADKMSIEEWNKQREAQVAKRDKR